MGECTCTLVTWHVHHGSCGPLMSTTATVWVTHLHSERIANISALDGAILFKFSGIIAEVLGYLTVSNLKRCHIPNRWAGCFTRSLAYKDIVAGGIWKQIFPEGYGLAKVPLSCPGWRWIQYFSNAHWHHFESLNKLDLLFQHFLIVVMEMDWPNGVYRWPQYWPNKINPAASSYF